MFKKTLTTFAVFVDYYGANFENSLALVAAFSGQFLSQAC
jgi:hypothetical protein